MLKFVIDKFFPILFTLHSSLFTVIYHMGKAGSHLETILRPVAHIENDFRGKFGIPRQSGLLPDMESAVVFEKEFRDPDALRGLEGFSHLWLIWLFSESIREGWSPTVRPPRLGGNRRVGVFAARSPFRPNPLGLSSVRLERIEHTADRGDVLIVSGADLMNGTPIFDIKPYIRYTDSHPDAVSGFADGAESYSLQVDCSEELLSLIPERCRSTVLSMLSQDPRPSYHTDEREYTMDYGSVSVTFTVEGGVLTVREVNELRETK